MNKLTLTAVLTICMVGVANADLFDFNTLSNGAGEGAITSYMSVLYSYPVTVTGARAVQDTSENPAWPGNSSTFIQTKNGADFEILFASTPITELLGLGGTGSTRGLVYDQTGDWDFQIFAYDSHYADEGHTVENPFSGSWVYTYQVVVSYDQAQVNIPDLIFSRPVSLLVISDEHAHDVALDDLEVTLVPVPAAVLLGILGLGVAGIKLRKHD